MWLPYLDPYLFKLSSIQLTQRVDMDVQITWSMIWWFLYTHLLLGKCKRILHGNKICHYRMFD